MFANHSWTWPSLLSIITLSAASTIQGARPDFNLASSGFSYEQNGAYGQAQSSVIPRNTPNTDSQASGSVQIALASYINPSGEGRKTWERILGPDSGKITILVANVDSGPGLAFDAEYARVIREAREKKKKVLGYVATGYLGFRPRQKQFDHPLTRPTPTDISDWIAQIQSDVDSWYRIYGKDDIHGIFLDEAYNECFGGGIDTAKIYQFISENIKRRYPESMTILNPGAAVKVCFEDSADTIVTFEGGFENYNDNYTKIDWTPKDPRKLWHIVHDVPKSHAAEMVAKARSNGVGFVQITDAAGNNPGDNPYLTLPSEAYMREVMRAVDGGSPAVSPVPALSGPHASSSIPSLKIAKQGDTFLNVNWDYHGESPYAIIVESDAHGEMVRIPGHFNRTTISGLNFGQQMAFSARALFEDGSMSERSTPVKTNATGQKAQSVSSSIASVQSSTSQAIAMAQSTSPAPQSTPTTQASTQTSSSSLSSSQTASTIASTSHTPSGTGSSAPAKSTSSASTRNLPIMHAVGATSQLIFGLFIMLAVSLLLV